MKGSLLVTACADCVLAAGVCASSADAAIVWQVHFAQSQSPIQAEPAVAEQSEPCPCVCPVSFVREEVAPMPMPRCEYRRPRWGGTMDIQRDDPDMSHSWGY